MIIFFQVSSNFCPVRNFLHFVVFRKVNCSSLKNEIIELTRTHLAGASFKAANRLLEGLDADGTLPSSQMDTRLKAANDILDRVGISKRQEIEHTGEIVHGVVLLPSKEPMKDITIEG